MFQCNIISDTDKQIQEEHIEVHQHRTCHDSAYQASDNPEEAVHESFMEAHRWGIVIVDIRSVHIAHRLFLTVLIQRCFQTCDFLVELLSPRH